jgi:hypothetical protein
MNISGRVMVYAGVVVLAIAAACNGSNATEPGTPQGVKDLRASLDAFTSFNLAKDAGYNTAITDCMSNGDVGAMGIHFANPAFIDATADAAHPEALIYEPGTNGQMSLVGVEFIVPFALVPKTATPPALFGQQFVQNNVFGVWALHVWTHRTNPSGLFASWNPRVHC